MSFFMARRPGKGADLGGLEGADRHCQALAQAAGAGNKMARLPEHSGGRRRPGRQRARSHRARTVAERQG